MTNISPVVSRWNLKSEDLQRSRGYDFDFILEAHRGMTLPEAVAFGRAVEPYRPMVLEDPVTPDNYDTMAEVASNRRADCYR